jgi:hypothetical protein
MNGVDCVSFECPFHEFLAHFVRVYSTLYLYIINFIAGICMPQSFDRHGLDYLQSDDYHSAITGLCSIFPTGPTRHVKKLHCHTFSESIKRVAASARMERLF